MRPHHCSSVSVTVERSNPTAEFPPNGAVRAGLNGDAPGDVSALSTLATLPLDCRFRRGMKGKTIDEGSALSFLTGARDGLLGKALVGVAPFP
jgi:hypothetical protein